jgi:hypothetical protein
LSLQKPNQGGEMTHSRILKLQAEKAVTNREFKERIKEEKKAVHKTYIKHNKRKIKIVDIMAIMVIFFNLSAILMTGMLVVKAEPDKGFAEVNPAQCEWNGFSCHSDWQDILIPFLKQIGILFFLVLGYLYYRFNITDDTSFHITGGIVLLYFVLTGLDFVNDLGLFIGKIIWGV